MAWTTRSIKKIQNNPPEKTKRHFEHGDVKGFYAQCTPAGTLTPGLQYNLNSKRKFHRLGDKLETGQDDKVIGAWLKAARRAAEDARDNVDAGRPPQGDVTTITSAGTLSQLLDVYLHTLEGKFSHNQVKRDLGRDARPLMGDRTAASITGSDISTVVKSVYRRAEQKGTRGDPSARRIRSLLRAAFEIGLTFDNDGKLQASFDGLCFGFPRGALNPVDTTPKIKAGKPRERKLSSDEIKKAWDAAPGFEDKRVGHAIRLGLLTGARAGTIAGLRWDEVSDDIFVAATEIGRNKRKVDHHLPVTPLMQKTLDDCKALFDGGKYVFPSMRGDGHMLPNRISDKMTDFCKHAKVDHFSFHALRKTCVTQMAKAGIDGDTRRLITSHATKQDVHDTDYDLRDWEDMRPQVLKGITRWHQVLGSMINPKPPTPLRKTGSSA